MLRLRLRALFRPSAVDNELDAELQFHLERQVEENLAAGMSQKEARSSAWRQFGGPVQRKEECRDMRRVDWIGNLTRDMRYAARTLGKSPTFTFVAVLSLALGLGANTAVFSIINPMLLRPLNVPDPSRLVRVFSGSKTGDYADSSSYLNYLDIQKSAHSFASLAAYSWPVAVSLGSRGGGPSERIWAFMVSGNYFDTLGAHPALGRTFLPEEDRTRGDHPVVVLSHRLWKERFDSDPNLAGRTIRLGGRPFEVIGVMPAATPRTDFLMSPDAWMPLAMQEKVMGFDKVKSRGESWLSLIGRLSPESSPSQARAELAGIAAHLEKIDPEKNHNLTLVVVPEPEGRSLVIPGLSKFGWIFLGVTGFVLLLACVNLASLQLSRSAARTREIGIRYAIGASRPRVFCQLLSESLLISLLGGVAGSLVAGVAVRGFLRSLPPISVPITLDASVDARVLVFALGISLLSGFLFGTLPALRVLDAQPVVGIRTGAPSRHPLQSLLVTGQLAISCLLLVAAALFIHSLHNAQQVALGFDPENRVLANVHPGMQGYSAEQSRRFFDRLLRRIESTPSVLAVSSSAMMPLGGGYLGDTNAYIDGEIPVPDFRRPKVYYDRVGARFFEAMGTPLVRGRDFTERDANSAAQVAVVNEAFAKTFWPGQDPIGKTFRLWGPSERPIEIVGTVPDGKYNSLGEDAQRHVFLAGPPQETLVIHTANDPDRLQKSLPAMVAEIDPDVPVTEVGTVERHLGFAYYPARIAASVMSILGGLSMLVAAIGVYGTFSFHVRRRTREFGIRSALGAGPSKLIALIVGQASILAGVGLLIGSAAALFFARLLGGMLYGVSSSDPTAFLSATALLGLVALISVLLPAVRAGHVDPMTALREE